MARKVTSRMELRKQAEAAEARGDEDAVKKKVKKAPAVRAKRTKEKVSARKRLVWVVFNGSMKEEGRFPYDQKAAAEEKADLLRSKSKRLYFVQPVKEVIGEPPAAAAAKGTKAAKGKAAAPIEIEEEVALDEELEADEEEEAEEEEVEEPEEE